MITFQHISVDRPANAGRRLQVDDVSFSVEAGEIFAIAGHMGAGKATLVRTVNGLVIPTQGETIVDRQTVSKLKRRELQSLRRQIGLVLNSPALMDHIPLYKNIALPLATYGDQDKTIQDRIERVLSLTGLSGLGSALPASLSFEQRKRGAIARALINNPKILLCLEPTGDLTPPEGDSILDLLKGLKEELNLTLLLTTCDLHVVKCLCGRAAIMQQGKLMEVNDTYSLFSMPQHPFTREFLSQQLSFDLPPDVKEHAYGTIVAIEYMGDPANEPVLYETAQRFGVEFNILQGRIEYIGGKPLGKMYVSFNAEPALMVSVLSYLKEHTYMAEVVQDV